METIYIVGNYLQENMGSKSFRKNQEAIDFCNEQKEEGWTWIGITYDPSTCKRGRILVSSKASNGPVAGGFDVTDIDSPHIPDGIKYTVRAIDNSSGEKQGVNGHFVRVENCHHLTGFDIDVIIPN